MLATTSCQRPKYSRWSAVAFLPLVAPLLVASAAEDNEWQLVRLRWTHAERRPVEALAQARAILETRPVGEVLAETLLLKGLAHALRKEWDEALVDLKSILVLAPTSSRAPHAAYTAALIHLARRETEHAHAIFHDLIRRYPESPYALRAQRITGGEDISRRHSSAASPASSLSTIALAPTGLLPHQRSDARARAALGSALHAQSYRLCSPAGTAITSLVVESFFQKFS